MTPEEKQKITTLINEKLGRRIMAKNYSYPDVHKIQLAPIDSISDAMEAVKILKIPMAIWIGSEAEGSVYVEILGTLIGIGEIDWNFSAAVSLAIMKYLEEK